MKKTILLLNLAMLLAPGAARALPQSFTYQGVLNNGALPALDGFYDLRFQLYEQPQAYAPPARDESTHPAVPVTNGVFTVTLSFPNAPFDGRNYWLEISAKTNGAVSFVTLLPRQAITPAPYALYAMSAGSLSGTLPPGKLPANVALLDRAQTFTAGQTFNGRVGIGTLTPASALDVVGTVNAISVAANAVQGHSTDMNGVQGTSASPIASGVYGENNSLGYGVAGRSSGTGTAVYGDNPGVAGWAGYFNGRLSVSGNVGIGTAAPGAKLHVATSGGVGVFAGDLGPFGGAEFESNVSAPATHAHAWFAENGSRVFSVGPGGESFIAGKVGIGTTVPQSKLTIVNSGPALVGTALSSTLVTSAGSLPSSVGADIALANFGFLSGNNESLGVRARRTATGTGWTSTALGLTFDVDNTVQAGAGLWLASSGNVGIGTATPQARLDVAGTTRTCILEVTGGCDLAEPFQISGSEIPKGSLVIIDEEHQGKLKLAGQEYDTRVAGIISGANGVNPGISLHQQGVIEGGQNVALSGRVYALADASSGSIKPGDLLTSSSTAGHVMKVTDPTRAQGAIVGKAMSALKEGTGMVLVLVSLQ